MKGFKVGRVLGIDLVIDPSWLIIAGLITTSLFIEFSTQDPNRSGRVVGLAAIVGSALFFGSVLVHELSHSVVARRRGIPVRRIRLFIFGGVSEIEQEAATPQDEFVISVVGPVSSLLLAAAFWGLDRALPSIDDPFGQLLGLLAFVNLALGLFNLVPGFPLDGGRVLRSAVWRASGDFRKATRVAATSGRVVGGLLAAGGAYLLFISGEPVGLWYLAIGWFLYQAARVGGVFGVARQDLAEVRVADLMVPVRLAAPAGITIETLLEDYLIGAAVHLPALPVADGGRVRGLVRFPDADAVTDRAATTVADIMAPIGPDDVVAAEAAIGELLPRFVNADAVKLVVAEGRVVGVLAAREVLALVARQA
ncbi:MAG: site-2 protease family protein [Acidimicrobiia bacterium]|nr:site-2 protease family protein [Acidimicrobiia bacterium]